MESIDFLAENWVFWWPRIWQTFHFWAKNGWKLEMLLSLLKLNRMRQNHRNVYFVSWHPIGELLVQFGVNWFFGWKLSFLMSADMSNLWFLSQNGWKLEMLFSLLKVNRMRQNCLNMYFVHRHPIGVHLVEFGVSWFFGWKLNFVMTTDMKNLSFLSQKWVKTWNASFSAKSE